MLPDNKTAVVKDSGTQQLKTEFTRDGFTYRQIWRQRDVAVYEYSSRGGSFEVVIIRVDPPTHLPSGEFMPARERYPRDTQWGALGWTFGPRDREVAFAVAEVLAKTRKNARIESARTTIDRMWAERRRAMRQTRTPSKPAVGPSVISNRLDGFHGPEDLCAEIERQEAFRLGGVQDLEVAA
jgi:hypothetical protein